MNKTHYNEEKMELYIEKLLEEREHRVFEERLENDKKFLEAFQKHKRDSRNIGQYAKAHTPKAIQQQQNLKETLDLLGNDYFSTQDNDGSNIENINKSKIKEFLIRYYKPSIAACLFSLLFASTIIYSNVQCTNHNIVNTFYEETKENQRSSTTRSITSKDKFKKAKRFYQKEEYSKAIGLLMAIHLTDSNYIKAQLYLGYCSMELKNYVKAIQFFETVIQSTELDHIENAQWNQLLAYVGNKQETTDKFQQKLKLILQEKDHVYRDKTIELKNSLDSLFRRFVWG